MGRRVSRDTALKYALHRLIADATRLLAIMEADLSARGTMVVHRRIPIPDRIESILLAQGPMGRGQIASVLARDGHSPVTTGSLSGTLDRMKRNGRVAYAEEKWRLATDESATAEPREQEEVD